MPYLFGSSFDGFERGMTVNIQRRITVKDSIGGSVRMIPFGGAALDCWKVETEFWCNATNAVLIEAAVPPYGVPGEKYLRLPGRSGVNSFPGLSPNTTDVYGEDAYYCDEVTRFESMGRKGPALNLYGYSVTLKLYESIDGGATNPATAPTTTAPTWLQQKFSARQLQDWSNTQRYGTEAYGYFSASYIKHGRRKDVNLNLDHLTASQADQLVAFFRGVRENTTTISVDNGPSGIQSVSVYLVGLQLHRTGLHWDGTLETVLA